MRKQEFLDALRMRLSGLPKQELDERLSFYSEIIEDRIEEGLTEEEATSEIGSVDEIAQQILADVPLARIAKERIKRKGRLNVGETILLVLGSPIWLSLLIAVAAVILSLYVVMWSLIISLWAVDVSLAACLLGGVASGVIFAVTGNVLTGIALIGAGILCAGLAIFLFFGCKAATKGTLLLTKNIAVGIKKRLVKKERAK